MELLSADGFYQWLEGHDLQLGSGFRGIKQIWRNEGHALGWMEIPETLDIGEEPYQTAHPAILDACLHLVGAALPRTEIYAKDAYLLIGMDTLTINKKPERRFWSDARLRKLTDGWEISSETITADINLFDEEGQCIAELRGMRFKKATRESGLVSQRDDIQKLLYELTWVPAAFSQKESITSVKQAASLDENLLLTDVAKVLNTTASNARIQSVMKIYETGLPEIDALCRNYIIHAFLKLGWDPTPGDAVSVETLMAELNIGQVHSKLVKRMLDILVEDSFLSVTQSNWVV